MPEIVEVFLGLGTNLGDRWANLRRAVQGLAPLTRVKMISPVYETKAWGVTDQPDFLNICLAGTTTLAPWPLLEELKALETALGRQKGERWGPRVIDIDILFYHNLIFQHERLTIPHLQIASRSFVLVPLADIAPDLIHPQTGLTVAQMLAQIDTADVRKLTKPLLEVE
jgi:2-amino-4-hydroxy-6-hydroxymethyldihydropteridine diphosphokinase